MEQKHNEGGFSHQKGSKGAILQSMGISTDTQSQRTQTYNGWTAVQIAYVQQARDLAKKLYEKDRMKDLKTSRARVVCYFMSPDNGVLRSVKAFSGYAAGNTKNRINALREVTGVRQDKETFCAEEHGVAQYGAGSLFSIAFTSTGAVAACKKENDGNGCENILAFLGIKDLICLELFPNGWAQ